MDLNVIPNFVYDMHFKNKDCKTVWFIIRFSLLIVGQSWNDILPEFQLDLTPLKLMKEIFSLIRISNQQLKLWKKKTTYLKRIIISIIFN